jgi:hypothetical protein
MIRSARRVFALFAILIAAGAAKTLHADEAAMHGDHAVVAGEELLGTVDFQVSCAEAAQPAFDRAPGFLHHMMYEQARSAFEGIVKTDPGCAMAHPGRRHHAVPAALAHPSERR